MIRIAYKFTGDWKRMHKMLKRLDPAVLSAAVYRPWAKAVRERHILQMYKDGGAVPGSGGQQKWDPEKKWTVMQKGPAAGHVMLSRRKFQYGTMSRSYKIETAPGGRGAKTLMTATIENTARSKSKWSPGFDYPSTLHRGWKGKGRIYPVNAAALAIPVMMAMGVGRGRNKRTGRFTGGGKKRWSGGVMIRMSVKKGSAKARPHIKFFGRDARLLNDMAWNFVATGKMKRGA